MSNFVSCWIHGGLGNQLFQIANCIEYGKKYNKIPFIMKLDIICTMKYL